MLIINADDFGLGEAENSGIALSFERGYCSSATLMPVAPAFLQACQVARENKFSDYIGLHISLCDGVALSKLLQRQKRFCDAEGRLIFSGQSVMISLTPQEKYALADEFRCQIARCRTAGIPLTHIDSHCHVHQIWSIASIVIAVARQEKIPFIRIKQNVSDVWRLKQRMYTYFFNVRLQALGMARTRYAVPIEMFLSLIDSRVAVRMRASCEINIHPFVNEHGVLMNRYFDAEHDLTHQIQALGNRSGIVSYAGKRHGVHV
ncbi:MAG TPA: ChbG/HpnK family deacetylase [Candidatus Omnitrophota bacterium]|nr:ChbG/HpnK family deacetylase [Candidatus Omnitrophota bacterium]